MTTRAECFTQSNLKKQSQFAGGQIGATSYLKGIYGNKPACGAAKNKANSKPILFSPQIFRGLKNEFEKSQLTSGILG